MLIDLTLNISPALPRRGGDLSAQKTPFRAFFYLELTSADVADIISAISLDR